MQASIQVNKITSQVKIKAKTSKANKYPSWASKIQKINFLSKKTNQKNKSFQNNLDTWILSLLVCFELGFMFF